MRVEWPSKNKVRLIDALVVDIEAIDPEFRKRYFDFLMTNSIFTVRGHSGGGIGRYHDVFYAEDAAKVRMFLHSEFPELRIKRGNR